IWCGLRPGDATNEGALRTAAARIDACLPRSGWRRWRDDVGRIFWWRDGDEFGRTTKARLTAEVHDVSWAPHEVVVTAYGAGGVDPACAPLYALVRAADRFDGFASLRRRRTKDGWETDVSLADRATTLTIDPCVLVEGGGDGATRATCNVDDLGDAEVDGAFERLIATASGCLWRPMWHPTPHDASSATVGTVTWNRWTPEQGASAANQSPVEVV